jgi:hypothetical protein
MGWSLRIIGGSGLSFYGLGFWQVCADIVQLSLATLLSDFRMLTVEIVFQRPRRMLGILLPRQHLIH